MLLLAKSDAAVAKEEVGGARGLLLEKLRKEPLKAVSRPEALRMPAAFIAPSGALFCFRRALCPLKPCRTAKQAMSFYHRWRGSVLLLSPVRLQSGNDMYNGTDGESASHCTSLFTQPLTAMDSGIGDRVRSAALGTRAYMAHARVAVVRPQPTAAAVGVAVVGRRALVAVLLTSNQHICEGPEGARRRQLAAEDGRGSHRSAVHFLVC